MNKLSTIKELIELLNKASEAYYKYDKPIMSDKEYDDLMDRLELLEKQTGQVMSNSPLHKVQGEVLESLNKIEHTRPMLSVQKTKDVNEIKKFIGNRKTIMSWKEDGLTIVLRYSQGKLKKAITRGKDGIVGEDVTHTMKLCSNIPLSISCNDDSEIRGECVMSWEEFNRINEGLTEPYSHPRNLVAGTVRQLDANIVKERKIEYTAFELVQNENSEDYLDIENSFDFLASLGFDVVEHRIVDRDNVEEAIKEFNPEYYRHPVDGLIFTYDDFKYGISLGRTEHHPLNMIALKWKDDEYETQLLDIEWTMGKTGSLCPTAVFKPVEMDGATVERASLHNITVMKHILGNKPYSGQVIRVYKSNKIIPQISWADKDNAPYYDTQYLSIPSACPVCGGNTAILKENDSEVLICTNPNCQGKLLGKLNHFVSKKAMDTDGLSEATLEFLINQGWVHSFADLYRMCKNPEIITKWKKSSGFGPKSVDKIINSIEQSRTVTLDRLLCAVSIPNVGSHAAKDIAKFCEYDIHKWNEIVSHADARRFKRIDGIGDKIVESIDEWVDTSWIDFLALTNELNIIKPEENKSIGVDLSGKTFVITGSVHIFKNRDAVKEKIESLGGKVAGSVSKNTTYLLNNDKESQSSKNKKAKELGIEIISEEDFVKMIGE